MIYHLDYPQIDKQKWDLCVSQSSNESIFVYSWYLDLVCKHWQAFVLNDYEAVFPIAVKSKYGFSYLYQPFFTRYFGVFSKTHLTPIVTEEFLQVIGMHYKQFQFCLHESNSVKSNTIAKKNRNFQYLNLVDSYKELYNNYSKNTKRNLKKSTFNDLQIVKNVHPEEIVQLFKTTKGNELEIFRQENYVSLIELMNYCLQHNKGESIGVHKNDVLLAATFFMKSNKRFTYLKSGITDSGKELGAMHFIMDYFIKENSGKDQILDFGGSSIESVARFYKGFGAKDCVYLELKAGNFFQLIKWIKSFKI